MKYQQSSLLKNITWIMQCCSSGLPNPKGMFVKEDSGRRRRFQSVFRKQNSQGFVHEHDVPLIFRLSDFFS